MAGMNFKITNKSLAHVKAITHSQVKLNDKALFGKLSITHNKPQGALIDALKDLKIDPEMVRVASSISIKLQSDPTIIAALKNATASGSSVEQIFEEVFGKVGISVIHDEEQNIVYLLNEHSVIKPGSMNPKTPITTKNLTVKAKEIRPIIEQKPKIEIKAPVPSAKEVAPRSKKGSKPSTADTGTAALLERLRVVTDEETKAPATAAKDTKPKVTAPTEDIMTITNGEILERLKAGNEASRKPGSIHVPPKEKDIQIEPTTPAPASSNSGAKTEAHLKAIKDMKGSSQARERANSEASIGETTFNIIMGSQISSTDQLLIYNLLEKLKETGGEKALLALNMASFLGRKEGEHESSLLERANTLLNDLTELQKITAIKPALSEDDKYIQILMMMIQLKLKKK